MAITGGRGTRAISKRYPSVDGLTAETTSQIGHEDRLIPQEDSKVEQKDSEGIR